MDLLVCFRVFAGLYLFLTLLAILANSVVLHVTKATKFLSSTRNFSDSAHQSNVFDVQSVEEFQEHVLNSRTPVLVDFYADWCGPCKVLGPLLEEKVSGRAGSLLMAKVNVDMAGELAMEHDVTAVPTVIAVREGEVVGRFQGVISDDQIEEFLDMAVGEDS